MLVDKFLQDISITGSSGGIVGKYESFLAMREISVSDRHLAMMLEAGVLQAFPLVGVERFKERHLSMNPSLFEGKSIVEHIHEVIAAIAVNVALMPGHKHILAADDEAMGMLRKMATWTNQKRVRHDAKLAVFELNPAARKHSAASAATTTPSKVTNVSCAGAPGP